MIDKVPLDARERLAAMFHELYNCHTASKCAAGEIGDREEFLQLKGMAEAYQDAESRVRALTTTPATSGATPSISEAIAEVERLRDEWAEELDHPNAFTVADQVAKTVWAAERIIAALRALQPSSEKENG